MGGEHDDFGVGVGEDDLADGFQAVEQRHGDVHEDDVGPQFLELGDGFATGLGFANDFHVFLEIEHAMESFADDGVIFSKEESDFFGGLHGELLLEF